MNYFRLPFQGVPTMRGDIEILAYNVIQWGGGELSWEKNKLLGTPVKVQQAKEELMSGIDSRLKTCFPNQQCPGKTFTTYKYKCKSISIHLIDNIAIVEPIAAFLKYVTKLKYDEKPDYEKCRKVFLDGLKALGKPNSGELEFKVSAASSSAAAKKVSPLKEQRPKVGRPSAKALAAATSAPKSNGNTENISPRAKSARKLDTSSEDSASPSKKVRTSKASTQVRPSKPSTQSRTSKATSTTSANSSIVVKNHVSEEKGKKNKNKTYNINLDLDISFDANVVVSVKRKKAKRPKDEADEIDSPNQSIRSTDEIPPTDKSFVVKTSKVYKRAQRSSPR